MRLHTFAVSASILGLVIAVGTIPVGAQIADLGLPTYLSNQVGGAK